MNEAMPVEEHFAYRANTYHMRLKYIPSVRVSEMGTNAMRDKLKEWAKVNPNILVTDGKVPTFSLFYVRTSYTFSLALLMLLSHC